MNDQEQMDEVDVAEVMTILTALDRWLQVTDQQVAVWQQALLASHKRLGFIPVRLVDAREAAMRIVTTREKADATPGLLIGEVVRLRGERSDAVSASALVPPEDLRPGQYPEWLRAAKRHIGDGASIEYALEAADMEMGASRRMLGPSTKHTVQELLRGRTA